MVVYRSGGRINFAGWLPLFGRCRLSNIDGTRNTLPNFRTGIVSPSEDPPDGVKSVNGGVKSLIRLDRRHIRVCNRPLIARRVGANGTAFVPFEKGAGYALPIEFQPGAGKRRRIERAYGDNDWIATKVGP